MCVLSLFVDHFPDGEAASFPDLFESFAWIRLDPREFQPRMVRIAAEPSLPVTFHGGERWVLRAHPRDTGRFAYFTLAMKHHP